MATAGTYFTNLTSTSQGVNKADACGNVVFKEDTATAKFGMRVTTGESGTVYIDLCGTAAGGYLQKANTSTSNTVKVRADVYNNAGDWLNSYTTPALYLDDICSVTTALAANKNIGEKLATAPSLPMYFRTICGDGLNNTTGRSIRITMKGPALQNGYRVSVMADVSGRTANVANNTADVSVSETAGNPGRVLVNGGPLGADLAIPEFSALMTKDPTDSAGTTGLIKLYTASPFFIGGGEGIDLSGMTFLIKQNKTGGIESYTTLSAPSSPVTPNAQGLYVYDLSKTVGAAGNSYRIVASSVTDKFNVYGYANQSAINGPVSLNNEAAAIAGTSITVDADASGALADWAVKEGGRAKVSFSAPNVPEGERTVTKYVARWCTRAQADAIAAKYTNEAISYKKLEEHHPNQHDIQTDICNSTGAVERFVVLKNLGNSKMFGDNKADNSSRYGVFVRAYTRGDNGAEVKGADLVDISATKFKETIVVADNTNLSANVSLGFYVTGAPARPSAIAVKVGASLLRDDSNTTTAVNKDTSMNNAFLIAFNDYKVDMRGSNYDSMRYAVIRSEDVQYATSDLYKDVSFLVDPYSKWNGEDAAAEYKNISGSRVAFKYDRVNDKWTTTTNTENDISNGYEFAVSYAFDNSNGMGARTEWYKFTPSKTSDTKNGLFSLDPSRNAQTTSGFGVALGGNQGTLENDGTFIANKAVEKARDYKVSQDNRAIGFGFSQMDASNQTLKSQGKAYKSDTTMDGGLPVNSIRYKVNKSAVVTNGAPTGGQAARTYGYTNRDLSGTSTIPVTEAFAQTVSATRDTDRLVVSQGYDQSGNLTALKNGQRIDIDFALLNANGRNDANYARVKGFAPMGTIGPIRNLRQGSAACQLNNQGYAVFDLSFSDLCGAAQHGGHLITKYNIQVSQWQGDISGRVILLTDNSGCAANEYFINNANAIANAGTAKAFRGRSITASAAQAMPGFPIDICMNAVAEVASSGDNAKVDNYYHNVGGVDVKGPDTRITIPGPKLANNNHDEVRSLVVSAADNSLKVSFWKPDLDAVKDQYQGAPSVNSYHIYQYDCSFTDLQKAMSLVKTTITSPTEIVKDYIETSVPAINGKAYIVAVHTQWRYGENNDTLQLTKGVYHTNLTSAGKVADPSYNATTGIYTLPASVRKVSNTALNLGDLRENGIPRGTPKITVTNNSLRFDDNGDELTVGAMIQIAPTSSGTGTNAFYLNICGATQGTPDTFDAAKNVNVSSIKVNSHKTNRKLYDLSYAGLLGANWATEKNIIVVQNKAGSAYVKVNVE